MGQSDITFVELGFEVVESIDQTFFWIFGFFQKPYIERVSPNFQNEISAQKR